MTAQPHYPAYPPPYAGQPMAPQYPYPQQPIAPQQYAYPPQAPVAPAPPVNASLSDYWDQPSSGEGPSLKFQDTNRQPRLGLRYVGRVARAIRDSDVRAQTNPQNGQLQTYRDGRPKLVMVVPLEEIFIQQPGMQLVPAAVEFPEGKAGWFVKGQARDELVRAMAEAGAAGAPEAGAIVDITLVSTRPVPGLNPQFIFQIRYVRPDVARAPAVDTTSAVQAAPAVIAQPSAQAAAPAAPAAPQPPANLSAEQQALLAKLTGQPA